MKSRVRHREISLYELLTELPVLSIVRRERLAERLVKQLLWVEIGV
jgi:hypothetical protein